MKLALFPAAVMGLGLLASCSPQPSEDVVTLIDATYTHALTENEEPTDNAAWFAPDATVYLSVQLKGRPGSGIVAAKFFLDDDIITEAAVDLAAVNQGVKTPTAENTWIGFSLTHTDPLPAGDGYRTELTLDGKTLGTFSFVIIPPDPVAPVEAAENDAASAGSQKPGGFAEFVKELNANKTIQVTKVTIFRGSEAGAAGDVVDGFTTEDRQLHVEFTLDLPVNASGSQVVWTLIKSETLEDVIIASVDLTEESLTNSITSFLNIDGPMPVGEYKVELIREEKALGEKNFSVK